MAISDVIPIKSNRRWNEKSELFFLLDAGADPDIQDVLGQTA